MSDDIIPTEDDTQPLTDKKSTSPSEKKRLARSEVRKALRVQRNKLIDLRKGMKEGQDLIDDIDSCRGEIDLLMKELQSIEEGGHTTFLSAKELIAPKKDVSSKKKTIKEGINSLQKEISAMEQSLYNPNLEQRERDRIIQKISERNKAKEDLDEELVALKQYNHTRFVEARDENRKNIELEEKLSDIESNLADLELKLLDAVEAHDHALMEEMKRKIAELLLIKDTLIKPEKDPFLQDEDETEKDLLKE
ncbi:MAG: hypothetical protein VX130_08030 [Verrucomicrobiota bacterium]|nr:hypothetical protein [Verrucomicrobiota bacterium]